MTAHPIQRRLQRDQRAFTLIELLVVIAIITLLASTAVFTMFGVREDVRETRARAAVAKINELIMEKWESYQTRAIPIRILPGTNPRMAAAMRLNAVRELMRMELPDRVTDLYLHDGSGNWVSPMLVGNPVAYFDTTPVALWAPPSAWLSYQRRIMANTARGSRWTEQHEHSECLYMILAGIRDGDTTGLEWFEESEIGDTDGDGMPEILDPWGRPIYFLRWAPGYASDLQDPARREPDPFDPLRVDPRWENNDDANPDTKLDDPFALFPLIYSGGRDRQYGVVRKDYEDDDGDPSTPPVDVEIIYGMTNTDPYAVARLREEPPPTPSRFPVPTWPVDFVARFPSSPWPSASGLWSSRPMNDPYMILPKSGDYVGRRFVTNNVGDDDITNHLLEVR
ncbi:MAG: type II secretion system protein [Pirellulaceae bacterium]